MVVSNESTDSDKWVFAVFANTVLRPPKTLKWIEKGFKRVFVILIRFKLRI